jgi:hypothetical protein
MVLEVEKTRLRNTGETQGMKMFLNFYLTIWDWSDAMNAATLLTLTVYVRPYNTQLDYILYLPAEKSNLFAMFIAGQLTVFFWVLRHVVNECSDAQTWKESINCSEKPENLYFMTVVGSIR